MSKKTPLPSLNIKSLIPSIFVGDGFLISLGALSPKKLRNYLWILPKNQFKFKRISDDENLTQENE